MKGTRRGGPGWVPIRVGRLSDAAKRGVSAFQCPRISQKQQLDFHSVRNKTVQKRSLLLVNYLVGACEERRNGDAERLRRLQIDDKIVPSRCLFAAILKLIGPAVNGAN
jgi:hypothetical protein